MQNRVMIDIETLDVAPTAAVFQIGVVVFDENFNEVAAKLFNINDLEEQLESGRTMSLGTMLFHMQTPDVLLESVNDKVSYSLDRAIAELRDCFKRHNVGDIWQKGDFDLKVLSDANGGDFWHYRQPRELRTLMAACGVSRGNPTHNALEDCRLQILKLKECYEVIND